MSKLIKKMISAAGIVMIFSVFTVLFSFAASASEVWQLRSDTNMRTSTSTSASVMYVLTSGTKITVTAKKTDSSYVWGKIKKNGQTGWCVLNYSTYKSGDLGKPTITTTATTFHGTVTLKWKSVPGASKYVLKIYNAGGKAYKSYTVSSASKSFTLPKGSYSAKVIAQNPKTSGWKATGSSYSFKVSDPLVSSITVSGSSSVAKGAKITLKASVSPSNAGNKSVSWSSSDKSILTVTSGGVVTGVAFGKTSVVCKAKDGSGVTKKFTVSVVPSACKAPAQSSADKTSAMVKWSSVSGAKGYQVYKYNTSSKKYEKFQTVTSTSCKITPIEVGATEKIKVRAYTKKGDTSFYGAFSPVITVTALPAAPEGLIGTSSKETSVSFKWKPVTAADKYAVYQYDESSKSYVKKAMTTETKYTAAVAPGSKVSFKVKAVKTLSDKNYYGTASAALTVYALPPAPSVNIKTSGNSVAISWSKVTGATGYIVYWATGTGSEFKTLSTNRADVLSLTVSNLKKGTYRFQIRAYATAGDTSYFGALSTAQTAKIS